MGMKNTSAESGDPVRSGLVAQAKWTGGSREVVLPVGATAVETHQEEAPRWRIPTGMRRCRGWGAVTGGCGSWTELWLEAVAARPDGGKEAPHLSSAPPTAVVRAGEEGHRRQC